MKHYIITVFMNNIQEFTFLASMLHECFVGVAHALIGHDMFADARANGRMGN